jgi:hypothetical protein
MEWLIRSFAENALPEFFAIFFLPKQKSHRSYSVVPVVLILGASLCLATKALYQNLLDFPSTI